MNADIDQGTASGLMFEDAFDWAAGLWVQSQPGHTRPVAALGQTRSGRIAAGRLFLGVSLGALDPRQVQAVLEGLRRLQCLDGSRQHGCFRWYAEETQITDTNAAFFIGLNLLALDRWRDRLEEPAREKLDVILNDLAVWFFHQAPTRHHHYPNKFMGDLVCAWLLAERPQADPAETGLVAEAMRLAATYWREQAWGWGEHLSDGYAGVLLDQLSTLLLLARRLPKDLGTAYHGLFAQLLDLDDQFAGAPRVPAIRSYAFTERAVVAPYRSRIRPWTPSQLEALRRGEVGFPFGDWFVRLGWHALAGPPAAPRERLTIPCFGGAVAQAWVTPRARLGSVSRYPVMDGVDHPDWGLSWQSMPVALAFGADGWGFLRWHTRREAESRHHPSREVARAYLGNALSWDKTPAIVGLTRSLQYGPEILAVRQMPRLLRDWSCVEDQFVISGSGIRGVAFDTHARDAGPLHRWVFTVAGEPVTVMHLSLDVPAAWHRMEEGAQWVGSAHWSGATLAGRSRLTGVWLITWGREVSAEAVQWRPWGARVGWQLFWPRAEGQVEIDITDTGFCREVGPGDTPQAGA